MAGYHYISRHTVLKFYARNGGSYNRRNAARSEEPMHTQPIETSSSSRQLSSEEVARADLRASAAGLARNEQERIVLVDNIICGLPPRAILERHPDLFTDVRAVYAAKRDLLVRFNDHCRVQNLRPA
jgi:hypothetical protein